MALTAPPSAPVDAVRDLATRIYVELVCRSVTVTDKAASIASDPVSLAKISFKLADAFQRAEAELKSASMPKNQDYELRATDLSGLMSARPD
jgi:hypothetical protein